MPGMEEGKRMKETIACLIVGFAAGIAFQRSMITMMIRKFPTTICDYCEWDRRKREGKDA